ncbi:MmyB family transcriptional regulator [Micromonospora parva]|uniref:MmyB family transcriptional regulator n=1 Tax=Micromonospora parva TaxID=1464048 RepID=UPI003649AB23
MLQQVHIDLRVEDPAQAHDQAIRLDARLPQAGDVGSDEGHQVYADPAGHPFCIGWGNRPERRWLHSSGTGWARRAPADAGLPVTRRRRTPGLRREELALLAGISATWLTYLEQGRDVRPSDQVLDALARALRLTGAEQAHLHRLAGAGAAPEQDVSEEATPEIAGVPALLGNNPAYVTGICYDLLATNDAAAELFQGMGPGGNVVRWVFTEPAARQMLVDWEQEARSILARLRAIDSTDLS